MRQHLLALLSAALSVALLPLPAWAGKAEVTYDHPERYADAGRGRDAESNRETLSAHLGELARLRLPASQRLDIVVTEIDLAGEVPPMVSARYGDVRVLGRSVDWPRITLRYTLRDGERVLAEGSDVVSDMNYLHHVGLQAGNGALPYERRMLSDWFERRFVAAGRQPVPTTELACRAVPAPAAAPHAAQGSPGSAGGGRPGAPSAAHAGAIP